MQSCSKNVLTGPLIGSTTGKGPGQTNNHLVAPKHDSSLLLSSTMTSTPSSISGGSITSTTISVPPPKKITCKIEEPNESLNLIVKPEIIDHSIMHNIHSITSIDVNGNGIDIKKCATHEKTVFVPHHPNYSLNPKLIEPEMSVSPARGSTGLPGIPPMQDSATQPLDATASLPPQNNMCLLPEVATGANGIGRRARVGKSMAREMVKQSYQNLNTSQNQQLETQQIIDKNIDHFHQSRSLENQNGKMFCPSEIKELHQKIIMPIPIALTNNNNILTDIPKTLIKKEDVKKECEEDVIILDKPEWEPTTQKCSNGLLDNSVCVNLSTNNTQDIPKSTKSDSLKRHLDVEDDDEKITNNIISLDDTFDASEAVKRRKILEYQKDPNKKSPPNSYKRLIKPSDPKTYLCKSDKQRKQTGHRQKYRLIRGINGKRKVFITDRRNKKILLATPTSMPMLNSPKRNRNRRLIKRRKRMGNNKVANSASELKVNGIIQVSIAENDDVEMEDIAKPSIETSDTNSDEPEQSPVVSAEQTSASTKEKEQFMSNLELTTDRIAKGYASDNEVLSRKKEKLKTIKSAENRSRSESKKDTSKSSTKDCKEALKNGKASKNASPARNSKANTKTSRDRSTSSSKSKERTTAPVTATKQTTATTKGTTKSTKANKKAVSNDKVSTENPKNINSKKATATTTTTIAASKQKSKPKSHVKKPKKMADTITDDEHILDNETNNNILIENNNKTYETIKADIRAPVAKPNAKKPKSRGNKFSNKKRHRVRHIKEIEEVIIPRRASAIPRWSNGWCWEGEPFQGKVFLNVRSFYKQIILITFFTLKTKI